MVLLKEKRIERNLTQKELAELSGVPQQNISAYENNARIPGADALYALAEALGATMNELYRPDGDRRPGTSSDTEEANECNDGDAATEYNDGDAATA